LDADECGQARIENESNLVKIYFIRHGESQANILRQISNRGLVHPLTRKGREQAVALADKLRDRAITRIYSSPVLRAIETSILVADRLGVEYEVTDALREFDCGIAEGRTDEEAWGMWQSAVDNWLLHQRWSGASPTVKVSATCATVSCRSWSDSWPNTATPMRTRCASAMAASSG